MGEREEQLRQWAAAELGSHSADESGWSSVAGDASSRRYFRLGRGENSWICVDAPPATENNDAFLLVRGLLASAGLRVPALLAVDSARGFMLLEDFGDSLLLDQLKELNADSYYQRALDMLLPMQAIDDDGLPSYSAAVLSEELSRFSEWFCEGLLKIPLGETEQALLGELEEALIAAAQQQPQVFVHRDYHSRNLMLMPGGELGLIDFQDAVVGPLCYDLVSLLRDCYIRWSPLQVKNWALAYRGRLQAAGLPAGEDEGQFLRWFDWVGLQRHLKVLGNFARLSLRDDKHVYLRDIPLVSEYVQAVLAEYAEFADFAQWYGEQVQPRIAAIDLDTRE